MAEGIEAEVIFGGGANPGFGVDGSGQVVVQVGALGHVQQKIAQLQGTGACGVEVAGSAFFERRHRGGGLRFCLRTRGRGEGQ
jgi:hypothetical protein